MEDASSGFTDVKENALSGCPPEATKLLALEAEPQEAPGAATGLLQEGQCPRGTYNRVEVNDNVTTVSISAANSREGDRLERNWWEGSVNCLRQIKETWAKRFRAEGTANGKREFAWHQENPESWCVWAP